MTQENTPSDEVFRPVVGYEGLYEVSNYGNVASLNYKNTGEWRLLSHGKRARGYRAVVLSDSGKMKNYLVHRLVALSFIPNPDNKPHIDHKDGNPENNHVSNLRWCTHQENHSFPSTRKKRSQSQLGKKRSDETKSKMSKIKKGENNPNYDSNSITQIWKRANEAGEYPYVCGTFHRVHNNHKHKDHQMVLDLIKKHTI